MRDSIPGVRKIRIRPMTKAELEGLLPRFILEDASGKEQGGVRSEEKRLSRAKKQIERLLPTGPDSQSMLAILAEVIDGVRIGYRWLSMSPREDFAEDGWI